MSDPVAEDIAQSKADFILAEVDFRRKLQQMQLANYANASGLPGVPTMGPLRVTNNYPPADPPPAPATATASAAAATTDEPPPAAPMPAPPIAVPSTAPIKAPSQGLSTLAKVGIAAAGLAIPGAGIAGLGAGALGTWLASKFSTPAATPAPNGQVTIGIGKDGRLFNPLQPGAAP